MPSATPAQAGRRGKAARRRSSIGNLALSACAPPRVVVFEARALLVRIGQLVIAVGKLVAAEEQLETFGDRRIAVADLRQRALRSRKIVDERDAVCVETPAAVGA